MDITESAGRVALTVSLSVEEFARALADGELRIALGGARALTAAEVARVCAAYGPESLGANLMWEIAQAGEAGIGAGALKELLGLPSSKRLAGVFSGLGKVLARELPGRKALFIERDWQAGPGEYHYRMAAPVRAAVLAHFG